MISQMLFSNYLLSFLSAMMHSSLWNHKEKKNLPLVTFVHSVLSQQQKVINSERNILFWFTVPEGWNPSSEYERHDNSYIRHGSMSNKLANHILFNLSNQREDNKEHQAIRCQSHYLDHQ